MSIQVQPAAIIEGPHINWRHVDGPLMTWAGNLHWLTWMERVRLSLRLATVDDVARERWPRLSAMRETLSR